jgi:hypothetical protein
LNANNSLVLGWEIPFGGVFFSSFFALAIFWFHKKENYGIQCWCLCYWNTGDILPVWSCLFLCNEEYFRHDLATAIV